MFVISHENKNRRPYDDLYYRISELRDETYSSLSQTLESQNTIKMLTLSVFELKNDSERSDFIMLSRASANRAWS